MVSSFAVGLIFTLIPFVPAPPMRLFVFVDGVALGMTLEWYVYLACEKISRMLIFFAFYKVTGLEIVSQFFVVECMDLGDFMLIMNRPWLILDGFEFDFNMMKVLIFTYIFFSYGRA